MASGSKIGKEIAAIPNSSKRMPGKRMVNVHVQAMICLTCSDGSLFHRGRFFTNGRRQDKDDKVEK